MTDSAPPLHAPAETARKAALNDLIAKTRNLSMSAGTWRTVLALLDTGTPDDWFGHATAPGWRWFANGINTVPLETVRHLVERFGPEVLTQERPLAAGGAPISPVQAVLNGAVVVGEANFKTAIVGALTPTANNAHDVNSARQAFVAEIARHVPFDALLQATTTELQRRRKDQHNAAVGGQTVGAVMGHPVSVLLLLTELRYEKAVGVLLGRFPHLHHERVHGHSAGTMLLRTTDGWAAYMDNGGSLAAPVYLNPTTGREQASSISLWRWVSDSGVLHQAIRDDVMAAVDRVQTGRPANAEERVFDDASWNEIVTHAGQLTREINDKNFEMKLRQDFRNALRGDRTWRSWRNSAGASVLHLLAATEPFGFIRHGASHISVPLLRSKDSSGNSVVPYAVIGADDTSNKQSLWGRDNRHAVLTRQHSGWDKLIEKVPEVFAGPTKGRGLLVSYSHAHSDAFFGQMAKARASYGSSIARTAMKVVYDNPQWMWEGWDKETVAVLFSSAERHKNVRWLLNAYLPIAFGVQPSGVGNAAEVCARAADALNGLPPEARAAVLVMATEPRFVGSVFGNPEVVKRLTAFTDGVMVGTHGLDAATLDGMRAVVTSNVNAQSYASAQTWLRNVEAWITSETLRAQAACAAAAGAPPEATSAAEPAKPRRRM